MGTVIVLLGHGSLHPQKLSYPEGMGTVAIPPGTTLQFFSDIGQTLMVSTNLLIDWSRLDTPWPPLTADNVTFNLTLAGFEDLSTALDRWEAMFDNDTTIDNILIPGYNLDPPHVLCNGTPDTCPVDPRQKRAHRCDGILGRYTADLYWIACTSVELPASPELRAAAGMTGEMVEETRRVVDAALGDAPRDVVLGGDPDDLLDNLRRHLSLVTDKAKFVRYIHEDLDDRARAIALTDPDIAAVVAAYPQD